MNKYSKQKIVHFYYTIVLEYSSTLFSYSLKKGIFKGGPFFLFKNMGGVVEYFEDAWTGRPYRRSRGRAPFLF